MEVGYKPTSHKEVQNLLGMGFFLGNYTFLLRYIASQALTCTKAYEWISSSIFVWTALLTYLIYSLLPAWVQQYCICELHLLRNIILTTIFSLSSSNTSADTLFSIALSLCSDYIGFLADIGLHQGLLFTSAVFYIFCSSSGMTASVLQLPSAELQLNRAH